VEALTYNERKKALLLLMFLKEKRDSLVKARMCTNGCKQKNSTWSKQDTTLPMVATDSVFITAIIDAHEGGECCLFQHSGGFFTRRR
jgi:hypothetical protein